MRRVYMIVVALEQPFAATDQLCDAAGFGRGAFGPFNVIAHGRHQLVIQSVEEQPEALAPRVAGGHRPEPGDRVTNPAMLQNQLESLARMDLLPKCDVD